MAGNKVEQVGWNQNTEAVGCEVIELKVGSSRGVWNSKISWSELSLWNISYVTTVCRIDQCQMWT